jgi:hypothetical protein
LQAIKTCATPRAPSEKADGSGSAVLWCNVDVQPTHVESGSVVDCDGTQEGAEELDTVWCWADNQDIADDAEDVGKGYQRSTNACTIRKPSSDHKGEATKDVYWNREVLRLKGVVSQGFDDRWQESRKAVEKNVLAEPED